MDGTTTLIIIAAIFAVVILVVVWRYRSRVEASIEVGGQKLSVKGENEPDTLEQSEPAQPAPSATVSISDAKAGKDIVAYDRTGRGAEIKGADAGGDILASSENLDPKG